MNTIRIIDSQEKVKDEYDFTFHEFYKPKFGGNLEFNIPEALVDAMQILRNFFKTSWEITSTIRPYKGQMLHTNGNAIDSIPVDDKLKLTVLSEFEEECIKYQQGLNDTLIEQLRIIGVNGFGIEGSCIHLDVRPDSNCTDVDKYGKYCIFTWKSDGSIKGKSTIIWRIKK